MGCFKNRLKPIILLGVFLIFIILNFLVNTYTLDFTYLTVHTFSLHSDSEVDTNNFTTIENGVSTEPNSTESTFEVTLADDVGEDEDVFPYMAAVLHINKNLLGAGAIVGKSWILVTAFQMGAFKPHQLTVRVGSHNANSGGQLISVQQLFPHPMFNQFNNDVALLKTAEPVVLSPAVQPIPLAVDPPEMGSPAMLLLWNEDFQIKKNQADVLPVTECRFFYHDFELTDGNICVVLDHILPFKVTLYGSPLLYNGSLIGLYQGWEPGTYKPSLCSNLAPIKAWVDLMMTNETDTQRLFPIS